MHKEGIGIVLVHVDLLTTMLRKTVDRNRMYSV